jgi:CPA2 family monovalent cation:H+ antiporter-2
MANAVVVIALFLVTSEFFRPWLDNKGLSLQIAQGVSLLTAFVSSAPFLWAIAGGRFGGKAASALWSERRFTGPLFAFEMFRWIFAVLLSASLASRIVAPDIVLIAVCALIMASIYFVPRHLEQIYQWLESRFVLNLNEKDVHDKKRALPVLAPWDSHLAELRVSSDSSLIGKKLGELNLRERFGVSITLIIRGRKTISAPGRNDVLYPADVLQVIGTDEQINRFKRECEALTVEISEAPDFIFGLHSIYIEQSSPYANKTIRDCGLREQTHSLVVGIEKKGQRTLNPDSGTFIEPGDVLWVVGDQNLMTGV